MNLSAILAVIGAALQGVGAATTGTISTIAHVVGAAALYLAKSPIKHGEDDGAPPTAA